MFVICKCQTAVEHILHIHWGNFELLTTGQRGRDRQGESECQCGSRKWKREELHVPLPDLSTYKVSSKMFFQVGHPAYLGALTLCSTQIQKKRDGEWGRMIGGESERNSQTDAGNVVSLEWIFRALPQIMRHFAAVVAKPRWGGRAEVASSYRNLTFKYLLASTCDILLITRGRKPGEDTGDTRFAWFRYGFWVEMESVL